MGDPPPLDPSELTFMQVLASMTVPQVVTVCAALVALLGGAYWVGQLRRAAEPSPSPQATPGVTESTKASRAAGSGATVRSWGA
jgi:hypothetical protein